LGRNLPEWVERLRFGDLVMVEWWDHSKREVRIGKDKVERIRLDVPVVSFGVFLGIGGEEMQHIMVGRDVFRWLEGTDFDIDMTSIMIPAVKEVKVLKRRVLNERYVEELRSAIKAGTARIIHRGHRVTFRRQTL